MTTQSTLANEASGKDGFVIALLSSVVVCAEELVSGARALSGKGTLALGMHLYAHSGCVGQANNDQVMLC